MNNFYQLISKASILTCFFCLCLSNSYAQQGPLNPDRNQPVPSFAPFYHGVASGDPLANSVIIWTRLTTDSLTADVDFTVALDTGMTSVVASGTFMTDASIDYTVKIDVTGLIPETYYYYEFEYENRRSIRGRTKTLPVGDVDSLRFAIVSCSSYGHGYFNAYRRIAERNDIEALIHLGDYIYEYENLGFGTTRNVEPINEILTIDDYRMRHSHYKLDSDLIAVHQQYPVISVWDDHETANDAWNGGAQNHDASEGSWADRKAAGIQAYHEWMPLRTPDVSNEERIYRRFQYGDLLDLNMLDTRLIGRSEQGTDNGLLGTTQYNWLINNLTTTSAQWKLLGQQVMMAPLEIFGIAFSQDQWDGYPTERNNLYNDILTNNVEGLVVLTGDIHTAWGQDLPRSTYDPNTGANSVGVEFVTASVTSPGLPIPIGQFLIQSQNPHNKYVDLDDHGYMILDVNKQRAHCDWYFVDDINNPSNNESWAQAWCNNTGTRHLVQCNSASVANPKYDVTPAPDAPRPVVVSTTQVDPNAPVMLGTYPNPFTEEFQLQVYMNTTASTTISIFDQNGKQITQFVRDDLHRGVNVIPVQAASLAPGIYHIVIQQGNSLQSKPIIKK